jgi:sugar/nucleoside kinase (ribokinase family)
MGPELVAIKRGEYGALLFNGDSKFFAPAYPLEEVYDPTGAGDTFAAGMLGFLAGQDSIDASSLRQGAVMGGVMASFCVEDFSLSGVQDLDLETITNRVDKFERLVDFETIDSID